MRVVGIAAMASAGVTLSVYVVFQRLIGVPLP
jgi:hypothetical protein